VGYFTNMGKSFKEFLEFYLKQSADLFQEAEYSDMLKVALVQPEKRENRPDPRNAGLGHGECFLGPGTELQARREDLQLVHLQLPHPDRAPAVRIEE
jgi:hypothetical protein